MARITDEHRIAFYRGSLRGLRYLEARKSRDRRFGKEADSRWASFGGDLTLSDRIDLMLRDADIEWPGAFRARSVFSLEGSAEDDPFGPEWEPPAAVLANEIWREETSSPLPEGFIPTMTAVLDCWGIQVKPFAVPPISTTDKYVVAGPSAVIAIAAAFGAASGVEWSEQVVCVAGTPGHRQLAALAAAFLGASRGTRLVSSIDELQRLKNMHVFLESDDAADSERAIISAFKSGGL